MNRTSPTTGQGRSYTSLIPSRHLKAIEEPKQESGLKRTTGRFEYVDAKELSKSSFTGLVLNGNLHNGTATTQNGATVIIKGGQTISSSTEKGSQQEAALTITPGKPAPNLSLLELAVNANAFTSFD